jgi:hypothetical protein
MPDRPSEASEQHDKSISIAKQLDRAGGPFHSAGLVAQDLEVSQSSWWCVGTG